MQKLSNDSSLGRKRPTIGVDLLGSDISSSAFLQTILESHEKISEDVDLVLFLKKEESSLPLPSSIQAIFVSEVIRMDDNPLAVLRKKKNSSIGKGMQLLKEKKIDAFISAGNTGALLAAAKTTLKTIKGIQRPAFMTLLPARNKKVAVLDVGANVKCKTSMMVQFAQMGIAYQQSQGCINPSVGLLNIGVEEKKGTIEHQQAYVALQKLNQALNYEAFLGNIEGRDVFKGPVDVLVTDGFTGNIFLKTAEGMANFLIEEISKEISQDPSCRASLSSSLSNLKKKLDYSEYPGAILCGVNGLVIKCHGTTSEQAVCHSIYAAKTLLSQKFLETVKSHISLYAS